MFDTVGRTIDPEAGRRRTASVLVVALTWGTAAGVMAWIGMNPPEVESAIEPDDDFRVVELDETPPKLTIPKAPRAAGGGAGDPNAEPTPAPTPIPTSTPTPLPPTVPSQQQNTSPQRGSNPDSPYDGKGDGAGPPSDGPCEGSDCGVGWGGDVVEVHHTELSLLRRPSPRYPAGVRTLASHKCTARIAIDERGRPYRVDVQEDCPDAFREATISGLMRWRWRTPRDEQGNPIRARTTIRVVFSPPR